MENLFNDNNVSFESSELINIDEEGNVIEKIEDGLEKLDSEKNSGLDSEVKDFINTDDDPSDESGNTGTESTNSGTLSPIALITKALSEEGIIGEIDEEELKNVEDPTEYLRNKIQEEIKNAEYSDLTDDQKKFLTALRDGIDPKQFIENQIDQKEILSISEEDLTDNDSLQKELIAKELRLRNFSEEDIREHLSDYNNLGKLEEKASKALIGLKKYELDKETHLKETAKKDRELQQTKMQDTLERVKSFVNSQNEIIPGIELNDKVKESVYNSMITAVGKDEHGSFINSVQKARMNNPVDFDTKLHYYNSLGMFDETPDFSKIINTLKSKQAKGLDNLLNSDPSIFEKNNKHKSNPDSNFDSKELESILDNF